MKLKYYLRGVGTGILFATIILLVSYAYKLSDGQIKKKALELGMVYPTEEQSSSNVADNQNGESQSDENDSAHMPSEEEPSSKEPDIEEPTTEEPTTEKPTTEEPTTEKPTTGDNTEVTCTITVTNRTASHHVAYQLQEAGIIDNAEEFNSYLIDNGYAYRIQNGTFTFKKGMSYKEMAEYLTSARW